LSFNTELIALLTKTLELLRAQVSEPVREPERPEPPPPRKLRQSEQPAIDMARMGRAAQEERRRRPLPRKPSWS
jgi:hypothetical protein